MANMANSEKKEGNNKFSRVVPGRYWCFTWNNYPETGVEQLEQLFKKYEIDYVIGKEIGESGTPHLQGFIKAKRVIRPIEKFGIKGIHWEKAKANEQANVSYCSKDGDFTTNIRTIKDNVKEFGAYPWQQEIIDICATTPDERTIHWYWEENGNVGKTALAKHLCLLHKDKVIYVNGKAADIKSAIATAKVKPEIVIFGIPRDKQEYMSYSALEEIKDGIFFSGKYESGMVMFPSPHIFVFCNFEPNYKNLSLDRWKVTHLGISQIPDDNDIDYISDDGEIHFV